MTGPGDDDTLSARHYATRAGAYVASRDHARGDDLDQMAAELQARGPQGHVLDLGCGGGHVSYRAAPFARRVTAADVTRSMLAAVAEEARARGLDNIATLEAPAERLPLAGASVDAVLCRFTAHHWMDLEAGLREARRVVAPDGWAMVMDVVAPAHPLLDTHLQTVELLRDPSHVRDYTVAEWMAALGRAGFTILSLTPRKLRMDFDDWADRTATPHDIRAAIRAVQRHADRSVLRHFAIDENGSFDLDTVAFVLRPA